MKENNCRVLLYDIETSPILGYTWGLWEQNVLKIVEDPYILCFAYKWLGEKKTHVLSLPDFSTYKKSKRDDRLLVEKLHELMDESQIIITQNGDRFDNKWANKQFIKHDLKPISTFKSIDTLKVARKHFRFDSNKLDSLGDFLGVGRKQKHQGMNMWFEVMNGNPKAWKEMIKYARQDVVLLEQIYYKLRPYMDTHPNLNAYNEQPDMQCPVCQSFNIQKRGFSIQGRFSKAQRYRCQDCGKWGQGSTTRIPDLAIS